MHLPSLQSLLQPQTPNLSECFYLQVLNLKRALREPLQTALHACLSAVRSTGFLASFVGLYQATVSAHRKLFTWDSKLVYYVAGRSWHGLQSSTQSNTRCNCSTMQLVGHGIVCSALGVQDAVGLQE